MHEEWNYLQQCRERSMELLTDCRMSWKGKATVIATGGLAKKIVPHCKREIILDDDLLLKGLAVIYRKNRKVQKSREEKR